MENIEKEKIAGLGSFYRRMLLEDVMPFWEKRTADREFGGFLTCFDRTGNLTDTDKYMWFQGRQIWMFATLFNQVAREQKWLELARIGRDFAVKHAYAGNGRWNYQLDRAGKIKVGTVSIYTDLFIVAGLSELASATGSDEDINLIRDTYSSIERAVHDPDFKDLFHGSWSPKFKRHGPYMITLNVANTVGHVLGAERTKPLIDYCLEQLLYVFAKDEHEALFESLSRDGTVDMDSPEGRLLNPGHAMESMWFCLEEGKRRGSRTIIERASKIIDWSYKLGYDKEYGGIVSYLDANGMEPVQTDWHKDINAMWHDKIWWVHCEAIYALAASALATGSNERFECFMDLHNWSWKNFHDKEYGEWYPELYRNGTAKLMDKGTLWKAAFHLPRAMLMAMKLFEGKI